MRTEIRAFFRTSSILLLAAMAGLFPPGAARAADPAAQARKAAEKALKKNTKPALKTFEELLQAKRATAITAIDDWDDVVKNTSFATAGTLALISAVNAFQRDVAFATRQFCDALGTAQGESVQIALDASIPLNPISNDFQVGGRGQLDDVIASASAAVDREVGKVRKRLSKLAKRLRADERVSFAFHLESPLPVVAPQCWDVGHTVPSLTLHRPNLDAVFAFSDMTIPGDAQLAIAGGAYPNMMGLTVGRLSEDFSSASATLQVPPDGRFVLYFGGLIEGNSSITVTISGLPLLIESIVLGVE